jgi:bifunctional DNA-binding transcriptional regulator/antitoxin component of YhaV-PrlF toxin-antitoxin module
MIYTSTVTSQGQITIPAPLRKTLFPKGSKVIIEIDTYNRQKNVSLKPMVTLNDAIGIAARYGAKIPKSLSVEKIIKKSRQEIANKAAKEDLQILGQHQN